VAIARLEAGNTSNVKWFSGIGEYKINWGPGYRVYMIQGCKNVFIFFGGGIKKSQKIDIHKAKQLFKEYKKRSSSI